MWPRCSRRSDLQAFLIFCFKPILISDHKLTLLIYGDNRGEWGGGGGGSIPLPSSCWGEARRRRHEGLRAAGCGACGGGAMGHGSGQGWGKEHEGVKGS